MLIPIARLRRWFALGAIIITVIVAAAYFFGHWQVRKALKAVPKKIGSQDQRPRIQPEDRQRLYERKSRVSRTAGQWLRHGCGLRGQRESPHIAVPDRDSVEWSESVQSDCQARCHYQGAAPGRARASTHDAQRRETGVGKSYVLPAR